MLGHELHRHDYGSWRQNFTYFFSRQAHPIQYLKKYLSEKVRRGGHIQCRLYNTRADLSHTSPIWCRPMASETLMRKPKPTRNTQCKHRNFRAQTHQTRPKLLQVWKRGRFQSQRQWWNCRNRSLSPRCLQMRLCVFAVGTRGLTFALKDASSIAPITHVALIWSPLVDKMLLRHRLAAHHIW